MPGTMWSDELMTCDYTDHVNCGDRPYPDWSTSPHPPSTTEETTTTTERTTTMEKTTTTEKVTSTSSPGPGSSTTTTKTPETTTSSHSGGTTSHSNIYFFRFHDIFLKVLMSFQVKFWGCMFFSLMTQRTGR